MIQRLVRILLSAYITGGVLPTKETVRKIPSNHVIPLTWNALIDNVASSKEWIA